MSGYAFMDRAPFHTVYLHGTARDTNHVKMSKSLGNGIDPLDVVRLYGADALRWTLIAGMGMGADVILDPADLDKSFATGRNFATKLWNIGRFILGAIGDDPVRPLDEIDRRHWTRADHWIVSRLDAAIADCDSALGPLAPTAPSAAADGRAWRTEERYAGLRLNEFAESSRRFVWNELADWYVEAVKGRLATPGPDRDVARAVLVFAFDHALRLLHPIVPFITEALWQKLPGVHGAEGTLLMQAAWPSSVRLPKGDERPAADFEVAREAILAIRQIRATYSVAPGRTIDVQIVAQAGHSTSNGHDVFGEEVAMISRLTRSTVALVGSGGR